MAEGRVQVGKALLVAPRLEPRGTSRYTVGLARELQRLGVEVSVFCAPGLMLAELHSAGVPVQTFDHLECMGWHFGERKAFRRAVEGLSPQIVHGQSFRAAGALGLLAGKDGLPLVLTVHWMPPRPRVLRRLARKLRGIIATTQAVREAVVNQCGIEGVKVRVIPDGIEVGRAGAQQPPPIFRSRVPAVGSLGPVEEMRGHELFVRAAAMLVRKGVSAQFVVAGEGGQLPELRKLLTKLGMDGHITLARDFASYADVLDALDVVVQNSLVNISGFSILESMGHGRPVIAFNTGTACEIIEDEQTGVLIPKGDVEALAAAIERLIVDSALARRMGQNARERVTEKFNIRTVAQQTLDYYAELLKA